MFWGCLVGVLGVFMGCLGVSGGCPGGVQGVVQGVFRRCLGGVEGVFRGCLGVSRGCPRGVQGVFRRCLGSWGMHLLQLAAADIHIEIITHVAHRVLRHAAPPVCSGAS